MTPESQAWTWMAEFFAKAHPGAEGWIAVPNARFEVAGLCGMLSRLVAAGRLSNPLRGDMTRRMGRHVTRRGRKRLYWWPRTRSGALQRAAFCRRMAKESR